MKKIEKVVFYGICKNGTCDALIEVNGKTEGNYNYASYKVMRHELKGQGFKFIKIEEQEVKQMLIDVIIIVILITLTLQISYAILILY